MSVLDHSREAQSAVEYGLLVATLALLVLFGTHAFGHVLLLWFQALIARITFLAG